MDSRERNYQKFRSVMRVLKIVVPTSFVLTLAVIIALIYRKHRQEEIQYRDISSTNGTSIEDSVQTAKGKIPKDEFEANNSAESLYADFRSNSVAFDKKYTGSTIDFYGTIGEIKTSWGCAIVEIKGDDRSGFDQIECTNCPTGKDKWSDEVTKVAVGDVVHIRGVYSGSTSDEFALDMYKCHIINQ